MFFEEQCIFATGGRSHYRIPSIVTAEFDLEWILGE